MKNKNKIGAFLIASIIAISIVAMAMPAMSGEDKAKVEEKPEVVIDEPPGPEPEPKKPEELEESKPEVREPDPRFHPVFRDAVIVYFKEMPTSLEEFASKYGGTLIFAKEDIKFAAFETEPISMPGETSQHTLDFIEEVSKDPRVEKAREDGFMFVRPDKVYMPEPKIVYPEDFDKKGWGYIPNEVKVGFWRLPQSFEEFASKYGAKLKDFDEANEFLLFATFETDNVTGFIKKISTDPYVRHAEPNGVVYGGYTPNDPKWNQQWGPKKIYCPEAWDYQKGSTSVAVAILDTGVDYNHEDLSGRVIKGYDYVNNDNDPMDDHNHGTHCAGICGAIMDNSKGIAGVAQVQILAVKVLNDQNQGTWANIAKGIRYAANNSAKVISMSIRGYGYDSDVEAACSYAYTTKGSLLVAVSGNDGIEQIAYPAAYDTVIAVGATNSNDQRWSSSNYGSQLELVAPGVDIHSTIRSNGYSNMTGTSMAAPHVSGVAGLIWSQNPSFNNDKVREILTNTAVDLGSSGWDKYYGHGKVNAYASVTVGKVLSSKSGSFSATGNTYNFSVSVPAPSAVNVVMAGNETADFDLYAKWGSPPTTSDYDARGFSVTSLEYFTVKGSGTLYIMVRSWRGSGNWKCWALSGDPSANSGRKSGTLSETGATATYSLSGTGIGYAFNSGPDGSDFDLYTKWNSPPTTSSYDARGYSGWAQEIAGPASGSGTLYFMVRSWYGSGEYATVGEIF